MLRLVKCLWTMVLVIFMFCLGVIASDKEMLFHHVILVDIPCDSLNDEDLIGLSESVFDGLDTQAVLPVATVLTETMGYRMLQEQSGELWCGTEWCDRSGDLPPGVYQVVRIGSEKSETSRHIFMIAGDKVVYLASEGRSFTDDMNGIQLFFLTCIGYLEKLCKI